jgi:hypothetical protein
MSDLHPDDEALSAQLDHEEPQLRGHIADCAICRSRLAEFARVRAAIGAPLPPPPARQRDAAVARALDAAARGTGPRGRAGAWAAGIAAALLVVLGGAFALSQLSSDRTKLQATSGAAKAQDRAVNEGAPLPAVPSLGDLGELKDSAALRAAIQPSVSEFTLRGVAGAAAPPRADKQTADSPTTTTATSACAGAARALDPANVRPAAVATATWQGTPAEVLVYAVEGRSGAARVYVLARADCHVLEFQSYAP